MTAIMKSVYQLLEQGAGETTYKGSLHSDTSNDKYDLDLSESNDNQALLAQYTLTNAELLASVGRFRPPQSWYEEDMEGLF